jgi:membrane fusion protein, multidrug efflux system
MSMRRLPFSPGVLLPLTLAVAVAAGGCGRAASAPKPARGPDAAPPVAVKQVPVQAVKVPRLLTLSGSLVGAEEAQVAAGAPGKVLATFVERGSVVKKGALLVRLDARVVSAQAQEAAAQLESLKAQRALALLDCQRNEQMFAKGAVSKADHDRAQTQCETSKWTVSAAEARKALTAEAQRDTEIRAPFSGMVVERFVTAGEYVRPDSPVVSLVDVDSLRVELTVPEGDVPQVRQGMAIDFHVAAAADRAQTYRGKIRYIGPSVRKQTRDAIVEAVVDNAGHDLRPGMFVTARLALGEHSLPAVPHTAVRAEGSLNHVFVVADGRLEDRVVQVSESRGGMVPIVSGLKAGEQVVAELTPDVRDGARVR